MQESVKIRNPQKKYPKSTAVVADGPLEYPLIQDCL